jgi:hypothetical protein
VLEIRKTELFANWLDGLRDLRARGRESRSESSVSLPETREMSNL